jgi:hypothetical protein
MKCDHGMWINRTVNRAIEPSTECGYFNTRPLEDITVEDIRRSVQFLFSTTADILRGFQEMQTLELFYALIVKPLNVKNICDKREYLGAKQRL